MTTKALLSIVPPYMTMNAPPAGAAALLGHLKREGLDFGFLDLRLSAPSVPSPTYDPVGMFGENFVMDIPDLPLALAIIAGFDDGQDGLFTAFDAPWFRTYCMERGLRHYRLRAYLKGIHDLAEDAFRSAKNVEFIGFSTWSSNLVTTLITCARLKRRAAPPFIVLGGPQVTESRASAMLALRSGLVDAVILGEGEAALADLYRAWEAGTLQDGVPGVLLRQPDGEVRDGGPRRMMHLKQMALADYHEMALPDYDNHHSALRLPFQLSRGCTDKCTFCSEWVFWKHFRLDTVDHAVEHIEHLMTEYGIRDFHFTDSLINGHMRRLRQFAENVIERGLDISWGGFMRADMDDETAALLKKAGLAYAFIGVESLSDETLELMNKRRTENDNARAIRAFLDAGVEVQVGIIPGFPGDTRARFIRSLETLDDIYGEYGDIFDYTSEPFILSPAQPIYQNLDEVGVTLGFWDDEILGLAPRYRDITENVACTVSGSNQGIERVGQLRLLKIMSEKQLNGSGINRPDEAVLDGVVFRNADGFAVAQLTNRGRLESVLIPASERRKCTRMARAARHFAAACEDPAFMAYWAGLQAQQLWPSDRPIYPDQGAAAPRAVGHYYIPHHVVARPQPGQGASGIVLFNGVSQVSDTLPAALAPVLQWLARRPRRTVDLHRELATVVHSADEAWKLVERLAGSGMIRARRPKAAAPVALSEPAPVMESPVPVP